jgi:hypothetical protein
MDTILPINKIATLHEHMLWMKSNGELHFCTTSARNILSSLIGILLELPTFSQPQLEGNKAPKALHRIPFFKQVYKKTTATRHATARHSRACLKDTSANRTETPKSDLKVALSLCFVVTQICSISIELCKFYGSFDAQKCQNGSSPLN